MHWKIFYKHSNNESITTQGRLLITQQKSFRIYCNLREQCLYTTKTELLLKPYSRIKIASYFYLSFVDLASQDGASLPDDPQTEAVKSRRPLSRGAGSRSRAYKVKTYSTCPPLPPVFHLIKPGSSCILWNMLFASIGLF